VPSLSSKSKDGEKEEGLNEQLLNKTKSSCVDAYLLVWEAPLDSPGRGGAWASGSE
jgi:hypothetical protein